MKVGITAVIFTHQSLQSHDLHMYTGCYGVPEEDSIDEDRSDLSSFTTVPWFCDACKAGIDPSTCVSRDTHFLVLIPINLVTISTLCN